MGPPSIERLSAGGLGFFVAQVKWNTSVLVYSIMRLKSWRMEENMKKQLNKIALVFSRLFS